MTHNSIDCGALATKLAMAFPGSALSSSCSRHLCRKSMNLSCGIACSSPHVNESGKAAFCKLIYQSQIHTDKSPLSKESLASAQPTSLGSPHCMANRSMPYQPSVL